MRGIIVLAMFTASLGHAAWNDYVEVRDLRLDAGSIGDLDIETGAGSLDVQGDGAADEIVVTATITVPEEDEDKAREQIEEGLKLSLEQAGSRAILISDFESSGWNRGWDESPSIQLEVRVPERLGLAIDDSSGSIEISNVRGDIELTDGSGSISMDRVGGNLTIEDGSGSIRITGAGNDVRIVDGSGSIDIDDVGGSVVVDDGSGSIEVRDVARDLIIEDDGSGGLRYSGIQGRVEEDT